MRRYLTLFVSTLALAGAACSTLPGGMGASNPSIEALPSVPETWRMAEQQVRGESIAWIEALSDQRLAVLVAEADASNPSLAVSRARINEARAIARLAGSALRPQVGAALSTESQGLVDGGGDSSIGLGLNFSWEVDLWGRLAARRSAAERSLESVEADFRASRNLLAAQVAETYFLAIEAQEQEAIANEVIDSVAEVLRIAEARRDAGLETAQGVALVQADLSSAREELIAIQGARRDLARALEVLLGRYPSAQLETNPELPELPPAPPSGLPSELLERRPDIVAAERNVAASLDSLSVAQTARLPSFTLNGGLGGASNDLSRILAPENLAWTAATSLLAPLFTGGAIDAEIDIASAQVEQATAVYAATALSAFREVESALDNSAVVERRFEEQAQRLGSSEEAYNFALARYEVGDTDMLDVLVIQQRMFAARSDALSLERQRLTQFIQLNLALGGDWQ